MPSSLKRLGSADYSHALLIDIKKYANKLSSEYTKHSNTIMNRLEKIESGLEDHFDKIESRLNDRFDRLDARLDRIEAHLDTMDAKGLESSSADSHDERRDLASRMQTIEKLRRLQMKMFRTLTA
jgi:predicted nuclease with TOPRIM domain